MMFYLFSLVLFVSPLYFWHTLTIQTTDNSLILTSYWLGSSHYSLGPFCTKETSSLEGRLNGEAFEFFTGGTGGLKPT